MKSCTRKCVCVQCLDSPYFSGVCCTSFTSLISFTFYGRYMWNSGTPSIMHMFPALQSVYICFYVSDGRCIFLHQRKRDSRNAWDIHISETHENSKIISLKYILRDSTHDNTAKMCSVDCDIFAIFSWLIFSQESVYVNYLDFLYFSGGCFT